MPIDTSIYGQIKPVQIESPLNALMQVSQVQGAQRQNKLAELALGQKEREIDFQGKRRNALTSALNPETGQLDDAAFTKGLASIGDYEWLQSHRTAQLTQQKAQREAEKAQLQTAAEKAELVGRYMAAAKENPALYPQILAALRQNIPGGGKDLPEQFDPSIVDATIQRAMSVKDQVAQVWKAKEFDFDEKKFAETKRSNQASERTAQANLGLKREEVGLKRQEVAAGGKPPPGYRWKGDGTLEPIPGGPAIKASQGTEGEKTAAGYGLRMQEAEKILSDVISKDSSAQKPGVLENATGGTGVVANVLRGPQRQRYRQAQEDWVRAKLRKESGAVIADEEMDREISVYFPQIGDSREVIQQKAQARQVAIAAMDQAAGQASGKASVPQSATSPDIDALLKKYGG